jgi:hypothetical protein
MNTLQQIEKQRKINRALIDARIYVNDCEGAEAFVILRDGNYFIEKKKLISENYEFKVYFKNGVIYVEDSTSKQIEPEAKKVSRKLSDSSDAIAD